MLESSKMNTSKLLLLIFLSYSLQTANTTTATFLQHSQQRPCPLNCSCNYDTIYCNDIIETCEECIYWSQIDFNRVTKLKYEAFKYYLFARNKITNIFIYNLLNDTIKQNSFKNFYVPVNSHIEITFHYNSLIKFNEYSLNGIYLDTNSTLVFNFPFTTQVIFFKNCFHEIFMKSPSSKFIIRILKSFMVRFTGSPFTQQQQQQPKSTNFNSGKFIIDIKSTRMITFEENCFENLNFFNKTKIYFDFELIEKLIFYSNTFKNINLYNNSQLILYLKQINYLSIKETLFKNINLYTKSSVRVYLNELANSICLNENAFSNINLFNDYTYLNLTIINSKNVVLTQKSFKNINILNENSKIVFHIYNLPSILFRKLNEMINYERSSYLLPVYEHLTPPELYYEQETAVQNENNYDYDNKFYMLPKQLYLYNLSIESKTFSIFSNNIEKNILFFIDNINTLLIDNQIIDAENDKSNLNFYLNIKNFVSQKTSFLNIKNIFIKFYKEPKLIKLDYEALKLTNIKIEATNVNTHQQQQQQVDVVLKHNSTQILCDYIEWKMKSVTIDLKSLKYCSCENFNLAIINTKTRYLPCLLADDVLRSCQIQFDLYCYNTLIINLNETKKLVVKNSVDIGRGIEFVKFWQICLNLRSGEPFETASLYFFNNLFDNDTGDSLPSSLLNFTETSSKESSNASYVGKIIGIVLVSLVVGIILFMLIINIIQYKLRSDQFDDFDGNTDNQQWSWKRTFSVQSLKRTLSMTSLKRNKKVVLVKDVDTNKACEVAGGDDYIFDSSDDDDVDFYVKKSEDDDKKENLICGGGDDDDKDSVKNESCKKNADASSNETCEKKTLFDGNVSRRNNEDLGYYSHD
jgi:hypothetical protein